MPATPQLRRSLDSITQGFVGNQVGEQLVAVHGLRKEWPHGVRAISPVNLDDHRSWRFNCHAFTLGFWKEELFWCLQESHPEAWPHSEFVTGYLLPAMTSIGSRDSSDGDLVLYYQGDVLQHSGILRGGRIDSKWGRCHTWEHGLFEVPQSYGSRVEYYHPLRIEVAMDAFLRFAEMA